jgi:tRNA 2-thiouridine synthesizing protein A
MEALTAVQVALLTIYDMCKAVDRGMTMEGHPPAGEARAASRATTSPLPSSSLESAARANVRLQTLETLTDACRPGARLSAGSTAPLPILRAKKVLGDLSAGQVLKVMATDPGSVKDFQAFCKQTGNELLSHSEGPEFTFFMKKR